ncbi:MAG: TRAP transporter small permease subunit [Hellea sp.]|nr:TRAP transporter small permease subunit [Hellea sp.]
MNWADSVELAASFLNGAGWAIFPLLALPFLCLLLPNQGFLERISSGVISTIDMICYGIGEIVKWGLPLLVLSVAFGVFAKEIFDKTWTQLFESATYFHAVVIMLGAAATLLANQHVRVDVFYHRMTPKKKARIDLLGFHLLLMPVCLILLWNGSDYASTAWINQESSVAPDGIPFKYMLMSTIALFSLTMLAQGLAVSLRAVKVLNDQAEPDLPKSIDPLFHASEGNH